MLGELSDLTCGDAWLPEIVQTDKVGSSFVVSRTPEAEELLEAAASREAVELSELGLRTAAGLAGPGAVQEEKAQGPDAAVHGCGGDSVPVYRQKLMAPIPSDYINMLKLLSRGTCCRATTASCAGS